MSTNWVVLKFGGTSVAGRPQWEAIAALLRARLDAGHHVAVVCSAVSGMTNELTALMGVEPREDELEDGLKNVLERHSRLAAELGVDDALWRPEAETRLRQAFAALGGAGDYSGQAEVLALGEWMSTRIGAEFLKQSLDVNWVDVRTALRIADEPQLSSARQWLSASCHPGADAGLQASWERLGKAILTQGFTAGTVDGKTALLGRGGSDTSAALIAGRLQASELEIWTDVPGLFSADPRLEPDARLLARLDYEEALEMAASGAKVVHPRCIRVAAACQTPLVIKDSGRPDLPGTHIGPHQDERGETHRAVKAITCQKDMMVLLLEKNDPRREVGFLAGVFDIFARHGVSVDLVATSETTTTVALNRAANHLDERASASLVGDLQKHCNVTPYTDCIGLNLVGSSVRTALADLGPAMRFFADHPLLMMSQSANDRCLSLLIEGRDYEQWLRQAHAALIPNPGDPSDGVFGPSWSEIQGR